MSMLHKCSVLFDGLQLNTEWENGKAGIIGKNSNKTVFVLKRERESAEYNQFIRTRKHGINVAFAL